MKHNIRAILYDLAKTKFVYILFVVFVFLQITFMTGEAETTDGFTVLSYFESMGTVSYSISFAFAIMLIGIVCGSGYVDKTINYEIMGGRKRGSIYMAKVIVSLVGGAISVFLSQILMLLYARATYDWGEGVTFGTMVLKNVIAIAPTIRVLCLFVLLAFIIRNEYLMMGIGFMMFLYGELVVMLFEKGAYIFSGFASIHKIMENATWSTFTFASPDIITFYDGTIPVGQTIIILISSICFGALFIWIGYEMFRKDDFR